MDKILSKAISKCMKDKRVIGICQHGFINRKCLIKLIVFYSEVTDVADQGRTLHVVHFHFLKAFGTVSPSLLISKLVEDKWIIKRVETFAGILGSKACDQWCKVQLYTSN